MEDRGWTGWIASQGENFAELGKYIATLVIGGLFAYVKNNWEKHSTEKETRKQIEEVAHELNPPHEDDQTLRATVEQIKVQAQRNETEIRKSRDEQQANMRVQEERHEANLNRFRALEDNDRCVRDQVNQVQQQVNQVQRDVIGSREDIRNVQQSVTSASDRTTRMMEDFGAKIVDKREKDKA